MRSRYCHGETCRCGADAFHKVEEVVFDDDPYPYRHPLTAYVCPACFSSLFRVPNSLKETDFD